MHSHCHTSVGQERSWGKQSTLIELLIWQQRRSTPTLAKKGDNHNSFAMNISICREQKITSTLQYFPYFENKDALMLLQRDLFLPKSSCREERQTSPLQKSCLKILKYYKSASLFKNKLWALLHCQGGRSNGWFGVQWDHRPVFWTLSPGSFLNLSLPKLQHTGDSFFTSSP